jgi:hypothetical protein
MKYARIAAVLCALGLWSAEGAAQAAGTYQLTRVGNDNLPAVIEQDEGCREEVNSATLMLDGSGGWTVTASGREVCKDEVETETETDSGKYTMDGKNIRFSGVDEDDDENGDDVFDMAHGVLEGKTLTIVGPGGRSMVFMKK